VVLGVHSDLATWWRWVKDSGRDEGTFPEYLQEQRTLARRALAAADVVVCPSEFLASEIARAYGLPEAPRVIHNAVTPLSPPELRVEREAHLAALVGRAWDEAKNLQLVAAALPRCRSAWRVDVAGDLAEPGREASPAATAPGLSYLGFLNKPALSRLFHRASVFIAPSSYEPFGLAAAEAALAGCAVVANDLPSYREVWGDAAAYFQRNDPAALAEVLDGLAAHPARVTHLAAAARERVLARYTPDRMVEQYLRVYAQSGRASEAGAPTPSQAPQAARVTVQPHPQLHPGGF
jgi:glycosyltransferase involved in cell wall biosynthesis